MKFTELGLAEPIVRSVASEGYTTPTPIQNKAIPEILAGRDVLGCAQTGTGKTGAFALPILQRLGRPAPGQLSPVSNDRPAGNGKRNRRGDRGRSDRRPRVLVLAPTRELATQIHDSFRTYGRHLPIRNAVIFGGVSQFHQVRALRDGVDVLVATPGRLLDLMNQGLVDLGGIEMFVLDEADRMLDMGFIRDIRKVAERLPAQRQTLLFSATMPGDIRRLADDMLDDPVFVQAARVAATADLINQSVFLVTRPNKPKLLERLLLRPGMDRTLVFTRTKHGADKLVKLLKRAGINAGAIHGNKNQNARTRALSGFKAGSTPVLVATDIASRGIDVDEISHVINYDMPNEAETYVHRIGRTARAGASGVALSFCDQDELSYLRSIERLIRKELDISTDAPDLAFNPISTRSERGGSRGGRRPVVHTPRRKGGKSGARRTRQSSGAGSPGRRKSSRNY